MPKSPTPAPIDLDQLPELARATMAAAKFPHLASIDSTGPHPQARVRPVSPVRTEGFTVYVANLKRYHKTAELAANPAVELCYLAPNHDQVRLTGTAEILRDTDLIGEIWASNPLLRQYLGSPENPELIIYRIVPDRVRFMREWALEYYEVPLDL